ncbi:flavin monoamine oxidase family protein [Mucilaginibacter ginkgonis]|uniref:Tryptophan 2-monooxygenase n=1 Tax=Mucilaginibacter ginkgonis TaxID=2682091 RepID=A0A6I4I1A7_9SPHI|nr:NAD(P)/FAD-dependent oxidoreductase [Mucilaginibacter ginkgonis]QQL48648.1 FAD-dependent oxidoreductase [Mucilaginibacter ginkgonis]
MEDILILGAGAAGLMAGRLLVKAGYKVTILEARDRIGGRIHTIYDQFGKTELGAEFVHGDLPVTLNLLKEAGIKYHAASGEMLHLDNGRLTEEGNEIDGWDELMDKMNGLKEDMNLADLLTVYFAGEEHEPLRDQAKRYVSGFDTADPADVSVFALCEEWQNEDEGAQHRLNYGYLEMINYLADEITSAGGQIILEAEVKDCNWSKDKVTVKTSNSESYKARKLIIALPLGVLKSDNALTFTPPIHSQQQAFRQIGFGAIIKVLLRFNTRFWEKLHDEDLSGALFFMSKEEIPTWWSQAPKHEALLTGWLGGNPARELTDASDEDILEKSLESLSNIFDLTVKELKEQMQSWHVANWTADPYTLGSYAYDMVGSDDAREILTSAIEDTIYFAGEYLYHGPAMGTVEAALTSAAAVATNIIDKSK